MNRTYTVGIPRAMSFYYFYPFYRGFLEALGVRVVLSPASTKRTLDDMRYCPTDEPCVPVKLCFAHAHRLCREDIDFLFVPVLVSLERDNYCCPKFIGIEAMLRNGLRLSPEFVLSPRINYREQGEEWKRTFYEVGRRLGIEDESLVEGALALGWEKQREFHQLTVTRRMTTVEAFRHLEGRPPAARRVYNPGVGFNPDLTVGVIGHAYTLYELISHNLVDRLREYGNVLTPEMIPEPEARAQLRTVGEGEKMWTFQGLMLGSALTMIRQGLVDKIVLVGPFECGPESIVENFIEAEADSHHIPFLLLSVDEQTGEAGIVTRLEAFMDTSARPIRGADMPARLARTDAPLDCQAGHESGHRSRRADPVRAQGQAADEPAETAGRGLLPDDFRAKTFPGETIQPGAGERGPAGEGLSGEEAARRTTGRVGESVRGTADPGRERATERVGAGGAATPAPDTGGGRPGSWLRLLGSLIPRPFRGPEPGNGMVVGTPTMGYLDIALRAALEDLGVSTVRTPRPSKRTVGLGMEIAPEFICYPMVTTIGQMREVLELGANTIFMVGGKGRCRLGWYAQVENLLLKKLGYEFDMVIIDSPVPLRTNWWPFRRTLARITNNASLWRIYKALRFGYLKMAAIDEAEQLLLKARAVESERGAADKVFRRFLRRIDRVTGISDLQKLSREYREEIDSLETEDTNPLRVRVVGEIYVVLEPFVNQGIEKLLGTRDHVRVAVDRELSASSWFRQHILRDRGLWHRHEVIAEAARPYLDELIGGHGLESVGLTVLTAREGMDGVIHLFPFTCMPEVVAQNILARVTEEMDIPFMSLIISEQTGEAGFVTRVEAFLDVLEDRRLSGRKPKTSPRSRETGEVV